MLPISLENVGQCADPVDGHLDGVALFLHRADADGGAAANHVARHQRHVMGYPANQPEGLKDHVADRVILSFVAVEHRFHHQRRHVEPGGDDRAVDAEGVEAFGPHPLGEGLVLADQLDGSDIVDAGIAKDIVRGVGLGYLLAFLADYDAEFALIDNLTVVGLGPADDLVGAEKGIVALEQVQRLFGLRHLHLGGQGVEVIPQCDHLGRLARRQQLHVGEEKRLARRLGPGEHVACIFFNSGFKNIHIIDLDGALEGKLINKNLIEGILKNTKLKIQIGGGIRSLEDINFFLDLGVDKVIVGTKAVENIEFLKKACDLYKNKIAVSIDVRNGYISLSGWKNQTGILASEFVKKIECFGISRIIYTDINKDGTKTGPNILDTLNFSKLTNIPVVVSGGISSINDIDSIKKKSSNIEGVIVGRAIYDGSINIKKLSEIV